MIIDNYKLMAQYNSWMNLKLYAICAGMSEEERTEDRGAFFGSIHGTLNHLLYADKIWMGRFNNKPFKDAVMGQILHESFKALRSERESLDESILLWSKNLNADWLAASFTFSSGVDGKTRTASAWILVTHMFNHQTHHRGQLTTLIRQAGYEPGITDIPWMPDLQIAPQFRGIAPRDNC